MQALKQIKSFSIMLLCLVIYMPTHADELKGSEAGKKKFVGGYRQLRWEDLMPAGWEPPKPKPVQHDNALLRALQNFGDEEAPVVDELDKQKVRIPGYIIPVKYDDVSVSEFLLVPYIGACIHVPPPPSNQMVYVKLAKPLPATNLWDAVWVNGTIRTETTQTDYAPTGYTMQSDKITKYEQ